MIEELSRCEVALNRQVAPEQNSVKTAEYALNFGTIILNKVFHASIIEEDKSRNHPELGAPAGGMVDGRRFRADQLGPIFFPSRSQRNGTKKVTIFFDIIRSPSVKTPSL